MGQHAFLLCTVHSPMTDDVNIDPTEGTEEAWVVIDLIYAGMVMVPLFLIRQHLMFPETANINSSPNGTILKEESTEIGSSTSLVDEEPTSSIVEPRSSAPSSLLATWRVSKPLIQHRAHQRDGFCDPMELLAEANAGPYICHCKEHGVECGHQFDSIGKLLQHLADHYAKFMAEHGSTDESPCCKKKWAKFNTVRFIDHYLSNHMPPGSKFFECPDCKKPFRSSSALHRHCNEQKHTKPVPPAWKNAVPEKLTVLR